MKKYLSIFSLLLLVGCAGTIRECSSYVAEEVGTDWIIVQNRMDGHPYNCWKLSSVSVGNERQSDGIYWKMPSGNLIHISGWYNKIQVTGGDFNRAAQDLGIELARCTNGKYISE